MPSEVCSVLSPGAARPVPLTLLWLTAHMPTRCSIPKGQEQGLPSSMSWSAGLTQGPGGDQGHRGPESGTRCCSRNRGAARDRLTQPCAATGPFGASLAEVRDRRMGHRTPPPAHHSSCCSGFLSLREIAERPQVGGGDCKGPVPSAAGGTPSRQDPGSPFRCRMFPSTAAETQGRSEMWPRSLG